jgi:hypothetical protein
MFIRTIFCILYLLYTTQANLNTIRNQYLRFYIQNGKARKLFCNIKEVTNKIYNSALSKYYDGQIFYYSLPEEDRDLIEQFIHIYF